MVGKVTVSEKCKSARTNGRDVEYGRAFVDMLTDKQLAFLVVHEAMHKAYRHMTVWKHLPDKQVANWAMDYVINLQIKDTDPSETEVAMPRDPKTGKLIGLLDEKYRGMDTKQSTTYSLRKAKVARVMRANAKVMGKMVSVIPPRAVDKLTNRQVVPMNLTSTTGKAHAN